MNKSTTVIAAMAISGVLNAAEYHVATIGDDNHPGSDTQPFKTISQAAKVAKPGDVITVHEGVYREEINPPRGGTSDDQRIVYQAAPGEQVTIKGSEQITGWKKVEKDTWKVVIPNSFFGDFNPYDDLIHGDWYEAKQAYHTGEVYLKGHWLTEAPNKKYLVKSTKNEADEDARAELMTIQQIYAGGKGGQTVQAKDYQAASEKIATHKNKDGKTYIGRILDGTTLTYEIDFGKDANHMSLAAASPIEGGWVEVRKDTAKGDLITKFDVGFSAEWDTFQPCGAMIQKPISGKHTIVLVFKKRPQRKKKNANIAYWFSEVDKKDTTIWAQFKGVDPNKELVEINVRQSVFYPRKPGMNYITVRGFTLEQAAPPWAPPTAKQIGLIGTHWSKGWVIENNTIRYSSCAGISLGKYGDKYDNTHNMFGAINRALKKGWSSEKIGNHLIKDNHIYNCGQAGINGNMGCAFSTITGNEIHDITKHHQYGGCETAGIKLHGFVDGIISNNHVYNCSHWGAIWLDWMGQGARITGNLCHDNQTQDLMLEVNHGPFMVDNNLFLSGHGMTKVSDGGAYVQNLWYSGIGIWPTETRTTPFFKPHSTEVVGMQAPIHQSDDRFINNIFVGPKGTSTLNASGFKLQKSIGNVFLKEALPSKQDKEAITPEKFDPEIKITKKADGWWLEMNVNPAWLKVKRPVVTSKLLGKPVTTKFSFEKPDGSKYKIDTDYFGNQRSSEHPAPGPFQWSKDKKIRVKVWPIEKEKTNPKAKVSSEPQTKEFVYRKLSNAELKMKIWYPPKWEKGGKKLPAAVFFFGGGWHGGEYSQFNTIASHLAKRGMIVVTPEYRIHSKHKIKPSQCLIDAKSAMRYVYKHADRLGIDAKKVAAGGRSAGGHLAAATAFCEGFNAKDDDLKISCKPAALILFNPVIDNGPDGFSHDWVKKYWKEFSPMHNIPKTPAPSIFLTGDKDQFTPIKTARKYQAEMERQGGRCDLVIYKGGVHGSPFHPHFRDTSILEMDKFLVSLGYLKKLRTLVM